MQKNPCKNEDLNQIRVARLLNTKPEIRSVPKFSMISSVKAEPLYKNYEFLYEKYVEKRWTATRIAGEIGSVHSTILEHLRDFGIPIRHDPKKQVHKLAGRGLAYGKRVIKDELVENKKELAVISMMVELRVKSLTYRKIAEILNDKAIPTKTRTAKWHATTVMKILKSNEFAMV